MSRNCYNWSNASQMQSPVFYDTEAPTSNYSLAYFDAKATSANSSQKLLLIIKKIKVVQIFDVVLEVIHIHVVFYKVYWEAIYGLLAHCLLSVFRVGKPKLNIFSLVFFSVKQLFPREEEWIRVAAALVDVYYCDPPALLANMNIKGVFQKQTKIRGVNNLFIHSFIHSFRNRKQVHTHTHTHYKRNTTSWPAQSVLT